jgi:hypothetical protein
MNCLREVQGLLETGGDGCDMGVARQTSLIGYRRIAVWLVNPSHLSLHQHQNIPLTTPQCSPLTSVPV